MLHVRKQAQSADTCARVKFLVSSIFEALGLFCFLCIFVFFVFFLFFHILHFFCILCIFLYFMFFLYFFSFFVVWLFTKSRNACVKEVLDSVGMRVLAQGRHESSRIHEEFIHARAIMPEAQKYTVEGGRMSPSAHRAL